MIPHNLSGRFSGNFIAYVSERFLFLSQLTFPSALFDGISAYIPSWLLIRTTCLKFAMFFTLAFCQNIYSWVINLLLTKLAGENTGVCSPWISLCRLCSA